MVEMACLAAGGFLGAAARYAVNVLAARRPGKLPAGTLLANVSGSFLLGWIAAAGLDRLWMLLLGTGFLGAFTTFSTFASESVNLFRNKERRMGVVYTGLTLLAGIGAAWLGSRLGA